MMNTIDQLVFVSIFPVSILFILFGLDDLFIDTVAWLNKIGPRKLSPEEYKSIYSLPEKSIAVLIASWKEGGVLCNMIRGNLGAIQYKNVTFFLGVYPNDPETIRDASQLELEFPNVHKIENLLNGPTTKGQMINHLVREIFNFEKRHDTRFDAFVIHDSEDIINPHAFKIMNWKLSQHEFVQIPVFSLPLPWHKLVGGTYLDEFSEAHTKDMLVRNYLGAPIPSAGVGTAIAGKLVKSICMVQNGDLLNSNSLTEDYELGLSTQLFQAKSSFACYCLSGITGNEFIATREYFPKSFRQSIRQKTRWTLGIAFQGWEHLGWKGEITHLYFLYRDRKGPVCNLASGIGLLLFSYSLIRFEANPTFLSTLTFSPRWNTLFSLNLILMVNRILLRCRSVYWVYGFKMAALVPVRFPIANSINAIAALRATSQYFMIRFFKVKPTWNKTEHELPESFGITQPQESTIKIKDRII